MSEYLPTRAHRGGMAHHPYSGGRYFARCGCRVDSDRDENLPPQVIRGMGCELHGGDIEGGRVGWGGWMIVRRDALGLDVAPPIVTDRTARERERTRRTRFSCISR